MPRIPLMSTVARVVAATAVSLCACTAESVTEPSPADQFRGLGPDEGTVAAGLVAPGGGFDDTCVLYVVLADYSDRALAVQRNFDDGAPYCDPLDDLLDRDDIIVAWDPADLSPITDQTFVQNTAYTYDLPAGRNNVDYQWLDGPLSVEFWGTVYGDIDQRSVSGLGDTCALYLETDEGTAYALLDDEDPSGACPNLDALVSGMTIRIPLADLTAVTDPTVTAALDATFTFGADHYVFVGAPPSAF